MKLFNNNLTFILSITLHVPVYLFASSQARSRTKGLGLTHCGKGGEERDERGLQQQASTPTAPSISEQERTNLATEAGKLGVMQAIDQTKQGASGWYVDVSGEIQFWNVGADGSWSRGQ